MVQVKPAGAEQGRSADDSRRLRAVSVRRVRDISRTMRRLTLGGEDLRTLQVSQPCEWAKIFLPRPTDDAPQIGRAYTLRGHRPQDNEVDIDVVLHEKGPLSDWARHARVGDQAFLAGPRGGYVCDPASQWIILAADASALPAMASILETLPRAVRVFGFVLVENFEDLELLPPSHRHRCQWTSAGVDQLVAMIRSVETPAGTGEVWAAGEAGLVRALRIHAVVERKLPKGQVHCAGYWKQGSQDHKDSAVS